MEWQYVDPSLSRRIDTWSSPTIGLEWSVVTYGEAGHPLLIFPTAAADFLENERFFLIKSIEPYIFQRRVQVFSIESINKHSWMDDQLPVAEKARRQALYSRYVEDEVVPFIRERNGNPQGRIAVSGASFGGFHASNAIFRRPELFDVLIAMSGFFDLERSYLQGYSDDNCYFNNPAWYLRDLGGERLDLLRNAVSLNIVTGQGQWEHPELSTDFSRFLDSKGIPHNLDLWGHDTPHDWPSWRKMLPYYIERLGW